MSGQNAVGILVEANDIDDGSALEIGGISGSLVPPRMTEGQMRAITDVLDGTMVYNSTVDLYFIRTNGAWSLFEYATVNTLILNKVGGNLPTLKEEFLNLPIGSGNVLVGNDKFYEVLGDGKIKVLRTGNYIINAELSVTNFPFTNRNFSLIVNKNNDLVGYLNRAQVKLEPNEPKQTRDFFGATGTVIINAVAGDVFDVMYNFDYDSMDLIVKFLNIGISKTL
ncbi:hypothetical protein [Nonlabens antarcticus]|uniref:hypothetical protein n=1 Tax=Nonlabens antarcticus TaxID=392714 RepID=UPI001890DCF8|nr:hypothetical protein [Nonlabens antarcticus]